jgi:hypothetical protein
MKNLTTNRLFQLGAAALVVAGLGYAYYNSDDSSGTEETATETASNENEAETTTSETTTETTSDTTVTESSETSTENTEK